MDEIVALDFTMAAVESKEEGAATSNGRTRCTSVGAVLYNITHAAVVARFIWYAGMGLDFPAKEMARAMDGRVWVAYNLPSEQLTVFLEEFGKKPPHCAGLIEVKDVLCAWMHRTRQIELVSEQAKAAAPKVHPNNRNLTSFVDFFGIRNHGVSIVDDAMAIYELLEAFIAARTMEAMWKRLSAKRPSTPLSAATAAAKAPEAAVVALSDAAHNFSFFAASVDGTGKRLAAARGVTLDIFTLAVAGSCNCVSTATCGVDFEGEVEPVLVQNVCCAFSEADRAALWAVRGPVECVCSTTVVLAEEPETAGIAKTFDGLAARYSPDGKGIVFPRRRVEMPAPSMAKDFVGWIKSLVVVMLAHGRMLSLVAEASHKGIPALMDSPPPRVTAPQPINRIPSDGQHQQGPSALPPLPSPPALLPHDAPVDNGAAPPRLVLRSANDDEAFLVPPMPKHRRYMRQDPVTIKSMVKAGITIVGNGAAATAAAMPQLRIASSERTKGPLVVVQPPQPTTRFAPTLPPPALCKFVVSSSDFGMPSFIEDGLRMPVVATHSIIADIAPLPVVIPPANTTTDLLTGIPENVFGGLTGDLDRKLAAEAYRVIKGLINPGYVCLPRPTDVSILASFSYDITVVDKPRHSTRKLSLPKTVMNPRRNDFTVPAFQAYDITPGARCRILKTFVCSRVCSFHDVQVLRS